jgi:hypothetical protein
MRPLTQAIDDASTQRAVRALEEGLRDLTGSPPTVTGATTAAQLASLIAALEQLGLIIDETT